MIKNLMFLLLSLSLILFSCNGSGSGGSGGNEAASAAGATKLSQPVNGKVFPLSIQKGGSYRSLDQIRVQARTIIDHRIEQSDKALAMMTHTYWYPEFVYNGKEMSKVDEYKGYWIKYGDDFRYQYGQYGKVFGEGRYHFRLEDKSLYMLDDDIEQEPKVWTVNYNGEAMAYVGVHEYKISNGMQLKFLAVGEQPKK